MRAIVGHSEALDTDQAIEDVLAQCAAELDGARPKAAFLFASVDYAHQRLLDRIDATWPGLPLIGGSTDGEVSSRAGFTHDSVLLTLLCGDGFEAHAAMAENLSDGIDAAVAHASAGLGDATPAACFTVFAPLTNSTAVVEALDRQIANPLCPVLGGLTADHRTFSSTQEFCGRRVAGDSLTVLYLIGDVPLSWGIGTGWFPLGEPHTVTRSEGHLVHTIDGQPAVDIYRAYWGDLPPGSLGEYPIAVFPDGLDQPYFLRAALDANPEEGWIHFVGDVPEGALVRVTDVLPEGILSGSDQAMRTALERFPGDRRPSLALVFSCAARKWVLGTQAEDEIDVLRRSVQQTNGTAELDLAVSGFYCFGEVAPFGPGQRARFHNETCVTVLLG